MEMKIASGDLSMPDAGASQGDDKQQLPGDASESLNPEPPSNYPRMVWDDVHVDSMNVDALPKDPAADAGDEVDSIEDHLLEAKRHEQVQGEVPLTGDGDAEQEQIDPSSSDRLMGEVQEEAPLTREGDAEQEQSNPSSGDPSISEDDEEAPLTGEGASQEEQCDPSSGDHPITDVRSIDPMDTGVTEEPSNPSHAGVTAIIPFLPPLPTTQPEETPQSTIYPTRMNDEVVDDAMRDLDPMSPPPKDLILCPQPLAVREVIDLDLVMAIATCKVESLTLMTPTSTSAMIHCLNEERGRLDSDGPLKLPLTWVLHRCRRILGVRTRKGQARQGRAGRALPGRRRRDPLWLDRGNHAELV